MTRQPPPKFYKLFTLGWPRSSAYWAMKHIWMGALGLFLLRVPAFGQSSQVLIIPDVVDGGGWQSTIALTNSTGSPANATLTFHSDTAGGGTQIWTPAFLDASSTSGLTIPGGSTTYLHTRGTAASLTQGWAQLDADSGVIAYVIFTNRVPGKQDQDATAPAVAGTSRILVPFDNSTGFVTAIAIVNPAATAQTIAVAFRVGSGQIIQSNLPSVPALGHMTFVLPQQFTATAGQSGLAEFFSSTGNFSLIALRFNPTLSSTAAPAYFMTGPPVITPASSGPNDPPPYSYQAPASPGN